jgi:hypothetical protein
MLSGNHESGFRGGSTNRAFRQEVKMGQRGIVKRGDSKMVVYEFYRRVPGEEDRLIGVLPERRNDKERITHQSIMNWGRLLVAEQIFSDKVYFVRVEGK